MGGVPRTLWIDASSGVAGDMLLGALVDVGVPVETLREAIEAVVPGSVSLQVTSAQRAGMRAVKVDVEVADEQPRRTWADIRGLLEGAPLHPAVGQAALRTFER